MKPSLLESTAIGWEGIEPVFIANIALGKPQALIGRHGICKTTTAQAIAKVFSEVGGFRFYDATKDDLISIAGIPKAEDLAKGILAFAEHDRSIWKANVIVVDELTRANRENQNLWLEILEERTCYGMPLIYQALIATMNPESYAATFKMDEALLDRFYSVIPVPDLQENTDSGTYKRLIELQYTRPEDQSGQTETLREAIEFTKKEYHLMRADEKVRDAISDFVGSLFEILHNQAAKGTYISPRKAVQLTEEIMGITAFLKWKGHKDPLIEGSRLALEYTMVVPLKLKRDMVEKLHRQLCVMLKKHSMTEADKIRLELTKRGGNERLDYISKTIEAIQKTLPLDEVDKLLNESYPLIESVNAGMERLQSWWKLCDQIEGHEEFKRKIEILVFAHIIEKVETQKINKVLPTIFNDETLDAEKQVQKELAEIGGLSQTQLVEKFLSEKSKNTTLFEEELF